MLQFLDGLYTMYVHRMSFDLFINFNRRFPRSPDNTKPREQREQFFNDQKNKVDKLSGNEKMFYDVCSALTRKKDMKMEFCTHNEVRTNNAFFQHKEQQKYTFSNTRGDKSIIDYLITNMKVEPQNILDVRVLTSANIGTHLKNLCRTYSHVCFRSYSRDI